MSPGCLWYWTHHGTGGCLGMGPQLEIAECFAEKMWDARSICLMISLGDFRCQDRRFAFLATFLGIIYHPCMVGICWLMLTSHISRRIKSACIQYRLQLWPAGCCTGVEVYNRTLCDVRVAARNPEGERSLSSSQISDWVINKKWRQKRLGVWCETLGDLCCH